MEELIQQLKLKDAVAFNQVMRMYKNPIFNYLNLVMGNRELAEELTQDTFVKVYFKAQTLKTGNLKAWIYAIATNLARSEYRKSKMKKLLSLGQANDNHFAFNPGYEKQLLLEQVLGTIPEKYRLPLVMKEQDNFSLEEIAAILNKPLGTVKSLIFRGRQLLRRQTAPGDNGGPDHE